MTDYYGQNQEKAALWAAILDSAVPKYGIDSKLVLLDFLTPKKPRVSHQNQTIHSIP